MIDAYAHVGLPRFQTVARYRVLMDSVGIRQAVLCSFDSSPDLAAIHAAFTAAPLKFRGIGVPLGRDRTEMEAGCRAQLAAGFSGLRLTEADVAERPWLLDIVAQAEAVAIVVGQVSSPSCARALASHLARAEALRIVGGHFAGMGHPRALADGAAAELFAHPRFHVTFSRHGGYPEAALRDWAEAVIARTGWGRVTWGSEAPVLFLRDETLPSAVAWIDRLAPTEPERAAFFEANARALYFDRAIVPAPLALLFDPAARARSQTSTLWPNGLPIDQALAGRLLDAWLGEGTPGTLGAFVEKLLDRVLA